MDILQDYLQYAGIAFALAAVLAPIIIHLLYNGGIVVKHVLMRNRVNEEFIKLQKHKSGTPTMGGLIVSFPFVILALLLLESSAVRNVFLAGYGFFALYGFVDEMIVKFNINNKQFRVFQETFVWRIGKLVLLYGIGLIVVLLMGMELGIKDVTIIPSVLTLSFGGLMAIVWGFLLIAGTYGAEITDGLDGLVTGLFLIAYSVYAVIVFLSGGLETLPLIALLTGSMLVYLYFNIPPARVFMGGVGAIPLGFGLVFLALLTDTFLPFMVITAVFWVELFSSVTQIVAIRFWGKKVFRIAPIHHHFESLGWSEPKIVMRFWLSGVVLALVGLWMFVAL